MFSNFLEDTILEKPSSIPTHKALFHILLIYPDSNTQELLTNISLPISDNSLKFSTLLDSISEFIDDNQVYYFSKNGKVYFSCGSSSTPLNGIISLSDLYQKNNSYLLALKITKPLKYNLNHAIENIISYFDKYLQGDELEDPHPLDFTSHEKESIQANGSDLTISKKKKKERKIKNVEELVRKWERLTRGDVDLNTGFLIKLTPEEAAEKVGVSVNALRNYYGKISKAKKFGFNFAAHANDDFRLLSEFVMRKSKSNSEDDSNEDTDECTPVSKLPQCKRIPNKKVS